MSKSLPNRRKIVPNIQKPGRIMLLRQLIKGDSMTADLFPNKKLQNAYSRGNAYLKQVTPERTTEVTANELNAYFNDAQLIQKADVVGDGNVTVVPNQQQEYTKFTLGAP